MFCPKAYMYELRLSLPLLTAIPNGYAGCGFGSDGGDVDGEYGPLALSGIESHDTESLPRWSSVSPRRYSRKKAKNPPANYIDSGGQWDKSGRKDEKKDKKDVEDISFFFFRQEATEQLKTAMVFMQRMNSAAALFYFSVVINEVAAVSAILHTRAYDEANVQAGVFRVHERGFSI